MFSKGAESRFCLAGCHFLCISVSLNTFAHTLRGVLAFEFFGMKTLKNPSVNASGHLFPKLSVSMPNCLRSGFLVCAVGEQWRVFLPCLTGSLTGECSLWKDKGDLCVYFYSRFYIDWRWNGRQLKIRIEKSSKVFFCFFPTSYTKHVSRTCRRTLAVDSQDFYLLCPHMDDQWDLTQTLH